MAEHNSSSPDATVDAAATALPPGRHFAITYGIADSFGGMTSAMLRRSRIFVRRGGVSVDILTFDVRHDYPAVEERLLASGEIIPGIRIVNLWDWLAENDLPVAGVVAHEFTPLEPAEPGDALRRDDPSGRSRTRLSDDGTVLQIDHFRPDGTVAVTDRRDVRSRGTPGGRSVVLCDREGRPRHSWGRIWSLYRAWLDALTDGETSFTIVDSKPMARFMLTYRRPHVVSAHMVHASHLAGRERPIGPLRASREQVFRNLDRFDSVVLLTASQRRDVEALLGAAPNLAVIPNSREVAPIDDDVFRRESHSGMVLAALVAGKRVDHAVRAVAAAREQGASDITLEVFGDGPRRAALERLASESTAADAIVFHGFRPDARDRLLSASFLLMTSATEGLSLVIVEAMAAGCIPISYDIPYGPADLIDDERNGFLVDDGDTDALARAIVRLQRLPPADAERMRRAARATAERYSDPHVAALWSAELHRALERKRRSTHGSLHSRVAAVLRSLRVEG